MGFHYADYIIFVLFLALSLSIGLYHAFRGGKQKTTEEFLMGDRKLQTFPVAISITLSFISAIVVLGQPAEVYTRGTQFSVVVLGQVCAIIFAIIFIVPIFFKLQVTSSFEYLDLRYNSKAVKLTGSIVMLIFSTIQLGIVLYAPSVALEAVAGLPTWVSIMFSSIVAIIYTTLGGMKAVIWTDVFQGGCVLVGMLAIVIQGILRVGGAVEVWSRNEINGRIEFFNMDPNPTVRTTFWSAFINGAFIAFSAMGIGQTTVQRYCALPTLGKARWSLMINVILLAIILILATASGLVIFAYYDLAGCDPIKGKLVSNANQLLPHFVMDVLNYPGFPGLFMSVLYGGALSTMSSSLNSAAAVTWQDILKKSFKHLDDSKKALVTKFLVVIFGGISVGMAFLTKFLGPHVLQAVSVVTGTVYGPLFGMFVMGMFFKCSNAKGAIAGCLSGIVLTSWIAIGSILTNQNNEILPTSISSCSANLSSFTTTANFTAKINFTTTTFINNLTTPYNSTFERSTSSFDDSSELEVYSFLNAIYSLSYLLYSFLGFVVTVTVGLLVSLCTGGLKETKIDPDLMASYDFFSKGFNCSGQVVKEKQLPLELVELKKANDIRKEKQTNSMLKDNKRTFSKTIF